MFKHDRVNFMYRTLISESIESLKNAISALGWEVPEDIRVEEPPDPDLGDLASSVSFLLAEAPQWISQMIFLK